MLMKRRAVVLGGIFTPVEDLAGLERAVDEIGEFDGNVFSFSFEGAMGDDFEDARRAMDGAHVVAFSAGKLAVTGETKPDFVQAINTPLVRPFHSIAFGGLQVASYHVRESMPGRDRPELHRPLVKGSVGEMVDPRSLWGNAKHLRAISRYDSIGVAAALRDAGVGVELNYMLDDEYFAPSKDEEARATSLGVVLDTHEGRHNQVMIDPEGTISATRHWAA